MNDLLQFVSLILIVVLVWGGYSLRNVDLKEYFSTNNGKGILKGIVLAILFAIVVGGISMLVPNKADAGTWFNDAHVFAGLDYTKNINPVCRTGSVDDRSGSNIGLVLNTYRNNRLSVNTKYTHHSCAFGADSRSYDALGVELKFKFWSR